MAMKIDQEYEVVRIDGSHDPLKEHPQNPNRGAVAEIDESIAENGWYGAVTAQRSTGYIIAGNHRYRVAKKRKAREIPVIWKDVDDETALKILLVDNKSTRDGEVDEEQLTQVLESLSSLKGTGYDSTLTSLERETNDERETEPTEPSEGDDEPLGLDDVPDDKYVPSWGVMVVCESEEDQAWVHEQLTETLPGHKLQVVAV